MPNMKKVNVSTPTLIYNLRTPLLGYHANLNMSEDDIFKCLLHVGTTVDEVLEDGTTIRLNFSNYKNDFSKIHVVEHQASDNNDASVSSKVPTTDMNIPEDAAKVSVEDTEKHDAPVDDGSNNAEAFEEDAEGVDVTTSTTTNEAENAAPATVDATASTTTNEEASYVDSSSATINNTTVEVAIDSDSQVDGTVSGTSNK